MGLCDFIYRFGKRRPVEQSAPPPEPPAVRPVNPYKPDWPLAQAWNRGFYDKLTHGRSIGRSPAYDEGFRAATCYIQSGAALRDRQAQSAR